MSHKPSRNLLLIGLFFMLVASACSSSSPDASDPPGFTCEYSPFGNGSASFTAPTVGQLGTFDHFVRVRVIGHDQTDSASHVRNNVRIEDSVFGSTSEGDEFLLTSVIGICLESGREYYLLLDGEADRSLNVPHPWAQFPVINNRITLHQDMRKDELIGDFHGLDPVLFKRRFVEAVDRTDIDVD